MSLAHQHRIGHVDDAQCTRSVTLLVLDRATKSFGAVQALVDGSITLLRRRGARAARRERRRQVDPGQDPRRRPPARHRRRCASTASRRTSPARRRRSAAGVSIIYQEPTLFPDLTVAENIFIGRQPLRGAAASTAAAMNAGRRRDVRPPRRRPRPVAPGPRPVGRRPADRRDRQGALVRRPGARHGRADRGADRGRGRRGCSTSCDAARAGRRRAVHLAPARGGLRRSASGSRSCATAASCGPTRSRTSTIDDIIRSMVGRDLDTLFPKTDDRRRATSCSQVERPHAARACSPTSRSRSGAARSSRWPGWSAPDAARSPGRSSASTATTPARSRIDGNALPSGSPSAAMAAGMALVPEDRRQQGLVMDMGIDHNVALASLRRLRAAGSDPPLRRARRSPPTWASRLQLKYGRLAQHRRRRSPAATSRRSCSPSGWPASRSC